MTILTVAMIICDLYNAIVTVTMMLCCLHRSFDGDDNVKDVGDHGDCYHDSSYVVFTMQ